MCNPPFSISTPKLPIPSTLNSCLFLPLPLLFDKEEVQLLLFIHVWVWGHPLDQCFNLFNSVTGVGGYSVYVAFVG